MKYERTESFRRDWDRLRSEERDLFRAAVRDFNEAAARHVADPDAAWPSRLHVKPMKGTSGIWEMTWSFAGPDGRATFEWIEVSGEPAVRWRRIGTHRIYESP